MNDKKTDKKYTESDKKKAKEVSESIRCMKFDDLEKMYWLMKGMKIARDTYDI